MEASDSRRRDRVAFVAFLAALAFLIYLAGCFSARWSWWPYPLIGNAVEAAKAWKEKWRPVSPFDTSFYHHANHGTGGLVRYDEKRTFNGLTLFSYGLDQKALLIDMNGRVVHQWHIPFSKVWKDPPHIDLPVDDALINAIMMRPSPDGDLLVVYATDRDTPFGYGLAKIDKDSRVIWRYPARAHHAVDVGADGRVYLLTHEIRTKELPSARVIQPFLDDYVVVLSPDGEQASKVSITDAFERSTYTSILENLKGWDVWHANDVEVLDGDRVESFDFLDEGCVLVSLKKLNTVAAIDLGAKKVIWARRGPWEGQHDLDLLADGNMLVFDNKGHVGTGGRSRIVEFNPRTLRTIWEYAGDEEHPFFSAIRSSQQRLPNGNTLITESDNGRIFEVTADKEIVWDYHTVFRAPGDPRRAAVMLKAERFDRGYFKFPFNGGK